MLSRGLLAPCIQSLHLTDMKDTVVVGSRFSECCHMFVYNILSFRIFMSIHVYICNPPSSKVMKVFLTRTRIFPSMAIVGHLLGHDAAVSKTDSNCNGLC